jgi:hypothetical protein
MKVHILFESSDHTNGRIVGVWTDKEVAKKNFLRHCYELAQKIEDHEFEWAYIDELVDMNPSCWSYLPDDTEGHSNVKVMLFLDCEVTA